MMGSKYKIYIDPRHGGRDLGAVANGMRESNIALEVSKYLGEMLRDVGVDVVMSRYDDTSLDINSRWQEANSVGASHLISVHVNAGGGTGSETFIHHHKQSDRAFATIVNDTYAEKMGLRNRGVKLDSATRHGSLGVLRFSQMPAILVELGFIDSPRDNPDIKMLRDRQLDIARALSEGVCKALGISATKPNTNEPATHTTPAEQSVASWAMDAMAWAKENGISTGERPQDNISRKEAVTMLHRAFNL